MPNFDWMEISIEIEDEYIIEAEYIVDGIRKKFLITEENDQNSTYLLDEHEIDTGSANSPFKFTLEGENGDQQIYALEPRRSKKIVRFFIQNGCIITVKKGDKIEKIEKDKIRLLRWRDKIAERRDDWCTTVCGYRICTG